MIARISHFVKILIYLIGTFFPSKFHFSFRDFARVTPAPFPGSHTCRDFTRPYPRWVSAPVGAKPMSTGHRAPPIVPSLRVYG